MKGYQAKKHMVINCLNIEDFDEDDYLFMKTIVSQERLLKSQSYHYIDDAIRCLCSEILLKYSLYETFGINYHFEIGCNDFGKPFIKNCDNFHYNISHAGKWVVIAYGKSELGIDVEMIKSGNEDVCDSYFTDEERKWIHKAPVEEAARRFTKIWTIKESYLKYIGTGLSGGLNTFVVDAEKNIILDLHRKIIDVKIVSLFLDELYYLSACGISDIYRIKLLLLKKMIAVWKSGL